MGIPVYTYVGLVGATLQRRYKRFIAEAILDETKEVVTCHIANPGSMFGMLPLNAPLRLQDHGAAKTRKLRYSVEAIKIGGTWIGTNTQIPNRVVDIMLRNPVKYPELLKALMNITGNKEKFSVQKEVTVKASSSNGKEIPLSRFDFCISSTQACPEDERFECMIEVKQVTMSSDWWFIENSFACASDPPRKLPLIPLQPNQRFSIVEQRSIAPHTESKKVKRQKLIEEGAQNHPPNVIPEEDTELKELVGLYEEDRVIREDISKDVPAECLEYFLNILRKKDIKFGLSLEFAAEAAEEKEASLVYNRIPKVALFPDAPTERGRKHLNGLSKWIETTSAGHKKESAASSSRGRKMKQRECCMLYYVARGDCQSFGSSSYCDASYAELLSECRALQGFKILPLSFEYSLDDVSRSEIVFNGVIPYKK